MKFGNVLGVHENPGLSHVTHKSMADLEPPIVAVACVVDSSTKLAVEWNRILAEYISPLFKRFTELYPGYQV